TPNGGVWPNVSVAGAPMTCASLPPTVYDSMTMFRASPKPVTVIVHPGAPVVSTGHRQKHGFRSTHLVSIFPFSGSITRSPLAGSDWLPLIFIQVRANRPLTIQAA